MIKKLDLPDVTLITFTSVRILDHLESLYKCVSNVNFGCIKFLSDKKPDNFPNFAEFIEINPINNIMDYNRFAFLELGNYVDTSHALLFQDHAYILNFDEFDKSWLKFSYIGAIWPFPTDNFSYRANTGEIIRNGNGGFSLRSAEMMRIPKKNNWYLKENHGYFNEDGNSTCYWRKEFLENGVVYAPPDVAAKFSYETPMPENNYGKIKTFGFHRNLPSIEKQGVNH